VQLCPEASDNQAASDDGADLCMIRLELKSLTEQDICQAF
jgi:hypothetical protein